MISQLEKIANEVGGAFAFVFVTVCKDKTGVEQVQTIIETSHPGIRPFFGKPGSHVHHRLGACMLNALADNDEADE